MPRDGQDLLNAAWLVVLFCTLGLAPATVMVRGLRLPRCFWPPLVLGSASAIAYALFWAFFFWPMTARSLSSVVMLAAAASFGVCLRSADVRGLLRSRDVWLPSLLFALVVVTDLGVLGWAGVPVTHRFTLPLPPEDHLFQRYFADRLFNDLYRDRAPQAFTTLLMEAHSSDRPPLQAAVILSVRSMGLGSGRFFVSDWAYQVLATSCQAGWVLTFYALGRVLALNRRQQGFVLLGAVASGFFLLNSVYVWPKLFAAWLFLTGLALVLWLMRSVGDAARTRRGVSVAAIAAGLMVLGMLAHGGAFFSILALPIVLVSREARRAFGIAHLAAMAAVALTLYGPWMAYQTLYDPPGNRLPKFHLAGVEEIDDRTTWAAIRDAYGGLTFAQYVWGRWENVREQGLILGKSGRGRLWEWVQWQQFFHNGAALDFLALGFVAIGRRRPDGLPLVMGYTVAALVVWIVLLFKPGSAFIHHGSYATTSLLLFCAAAGLASLPPWVRRPAMALHVVLFASCWLAQRTLEGRPDAPTPSPVWSVAWLIVAVIGFGAFVIALRALVDTDVPLLTDADPVLRVSVQQDVVHAQLRQREPTR